MNESTKLESKKNNNVKYSTTVNRSIFCCRKCGKKKQANVDLTQTTIKTAKEKRLKA